MAIAHVGGTTGHHEGVLLYDDVAPILDLCDRHGVRIAIASRTEQPTWARQLIELLAITERFSYFEIYPSTKVKHFAALRETSGVEFDQMVFFDDEMRNIHEVSALGVTSIHVLQGLTLELFEDSLRRFTRG